MSPVRPTLHITGASGAGTSTLGRALADRLGVVHLDTDDFYWQPVEPKFTRKRPPGERVALLEAAFARAAERGWVLSGSITAWGDPLLPRFTGVIFMTAPVEMRLARLEEREAGEFGQAALSPGGSRHEEYAAFLAWAAAYDDDEAVGRNRKRHEAWLATLDCPVLRLDGTRPVAGLVEEVVGNLGLEPG